VRVNERLHQEITEKRKRLILGSDGMFSFGCVIAGTAEAEHGSEGDGQEVTTR
jgi:hypothetical protein